MPGLIDAHVHLFLHPGDEDLQTVQESVPQRTLDRRRRRKPDLLAGFTAERDMGTEGAGCADVAVRNAINSGLIPGPRMRMCCNAIDIIGGHEDATGFNPAQHVLSNADYANSADEIVEVMREQRKARSRLHQDLRDRTRLPPRWSLPHALPVHRSRTRRRRSRGRTHGGTHLRRGVAVHCTGEPGTGYAAAAGVASIDHAYQLSDATMKLMHDKEIYAVPTFAIAEYFADHAETPERAAHPAPSRPTTPPSSKSRWPQAFPSPSAPT